MTHKHKLILWCCTSIIASILLIVLIFFHNPFSEPELEYQTPTGFKETIIVVADEEYPPFSYYNSDGEVIGSDIELVYAIAQQMQVNVDLRLMAWPEPCTMVETGKADIVMGIEYVQYYINKFLLTDPVEISQFVTFGMNNYTTPQDLYSKKVGAITCSATKNLITTPLALVNDVIIYDQYEDAYNDILNGSLDYLIGRFPLGNMVLKQQGITQIKAVGPSLSHSALCFGLNLENEALLIRINEAIQTLNEQGVLAKISEKWLGSYANVMTWREYINLNTDSILLLLVIILLISLLFITYSFIVMSKQAKTDLATGLMNKHTAETRIKRLITCLQDCKGMLCIVDIDNLKDINDTLGHMAGDRCILIVAQTIRKVCKNAQVIGRIGGDEFCFFIKPIKSPDQALFQAEQLIAQILAQAIKEDLNTHLSISAGLTMVHAGDSYDEAFLKADEALYQAKSTGKSQAIFL